MTTGLVADFARTEVCLCIIQQTRTTSSNNAGHRKHEVAQKIDGPYFKFPEHEKGVGFQDKC
jgi:hypothetical protein